MTSLLSQRVWWQTAGSPMRTGNVRALAYDTVNECFAALVEDDDGKLYEVTATCLRTTQPEERS